MKDISLKLISNTQKVYTTLTMIYPFCLKEWKFQKFQKFVANLHDKTEYVIDIRNLKQALNHVLLLKKVHIMIKFNQKDWLESYIYFSTYLRKESKRSWFGKTFFWSWWIVLRKTVENVWKHGGIKQQQETIWYQNQIIMLQSFSQNICCL